jgi:hypothetical protein
MDDTNRLRRRYRIMLAISIFFLLLSVVLFFLTSGFARWVLLLIWVFITFARWQALKSVPPAD